MGNWVKEAHRRNWGKVNGAAAREGFPVRSSGEEEAEVGTEGRSRGPGCSLLAASRQQEDRALQGKMILDLSGPEQGKLSRCVAQQATGNIHEDLPEKEGAQVSYSHAL